MDSPSSSPTNGSTDSSPRKPPRGCFWLLLLAGCITLLVFDCEGCLDSEDSGSFFSSAEDLGVVLLPPGTPLNEAQSYLWSVEGLDPSRHQVKYGLGPSLVEKIEHDEEELGRRMHFRALSQSRFTFRAPPD